MARGALNWTVRDLAEAAGVHRNTISNIEVGRYAGDGKTLKAIESAFGRAGARITSLSPGRQAGPLIGKSLPKYRYMVCRI